MSDEKRKKIVFLCRVIAIASATMQLILLAVMMNADVVWTSSLASVLKAATYVLWAGLLVPVIVIIQIQWKDKQRKTDDKIRELESEVRRLRQK